MLYIEGASRLKWIYFKAECLSNGFRESIRKQRIQTGWESLQKENQSTNWATEQTENHCGRWLQTKTGVISCSLPACCDLETLRLMAQRNACVQYTCACLYLSVYFKQSALYVFKWWIAYCLPPWTYITYAALPLCLRSGAGLFASPPYNVCFINDTVVWWQSTGLLLGKSICHLWNQTKGACSTVGVCYLTSTLLKPSHLHLEWMPYCWWGSIPLGQNPSQPLCLLLCSAQRVKQ